MVGEDPRVGSVLHGRYRIVERLTAGTMGVVYRAERVGLGRWVAVKVLHESFASTEDGIRRFEVEAQAMSRLSHPNCVGVIDFGVADDGAPYLVMDFVTGRTLREIIRSDVRLAPERAVRIVRQIVAGLAHAHGQGIIHRDMKPENIVVTHIEGQGEQVRILDFGLAKLRGNKSVTTGVALGTPGYMSPEQTIGRSVDNRADVYAVGIILYELLVGRKPFQASDAFEVMRMHREDPVLPLSQLSLGTSFSSQLEALVLRALAKDPDGRFPSMQELGMAIDDTPEARGHAAVSRRGAILLAASAAVVVTAIALAVWPSPSGDAGEGAAPADETATTAPKPRARKHHGPKRAVADAAPAVVADDDLDAAAFEVVADGPDGGTDISDQVDELLARAADGKGKQALRELEALRARDPGRAQVHYALGNLYTEQLQWQSAVSAYATAITLDSSYAVDERLIGDVVEALANNKAHRSAAQLITSALGEAALPRLEEATRSANPRLRARAKKVRHVIEVTGEQ